MSHGQIRVATPGGCTTKIIEVPPPSVLDDDVITATLVDLINAAYNEASADFFQPGYLRTSTQGVIDTVKAGELAVASVPADTPFKSKSGRVPVGCISIK
ncbi:hypothetical protein GGR53DRAFT_467459 [Hypoxylon sp. FL1150]|nr:hypothetical protein GGR53DRAFT_467459 [Hypoxylon sp. FL1150]